MLFDSRNVYNQKSLTKDVYRACIMINDNLMY